MRKKLFSILLILCLVLTLLPSAAVAIPSFKLTVGNTNVSALYEDNWDDTSVHYWKEAESGDAAYAETGSTDDYLFSVSFDWDSDLFTLTLNGVDITSYYKPGSYDYGIYSNTSLNIVLESGTANSIDMSSSSASESSGIHVSGALTISGDGSMSASGGTYGIEAWGNEPSLNITGGTISVSGTAYGSLVDGNVTISGGAVSAAASGDNSDGIAATGDLTVSGGSVTASGNRSALNVNGSTSVTIASYKYRTNTTASAPETGYTYYPGTAFENSGDFKYVEIQGLKDVYIGSTVVSTTAGGVSYWVNDDDGGGITSTGADENNYSAKYDNSSSTLTLNGLDLTDSYNNSNPYFGQESLGIYSTGPLNIVLADGSYNSINTVTTENMASINIKAEGDITVEGSGSLSLDAETNTDEGSFTHGIYSSEDITITGGAITVAAADTDSVYGLSAEGDITIEGGSVFIDANNAWSNGIGISTGEGNITISGGTVIALTDNCNSSSYGLNSYTGNIDITGGAVYATGNPSGAAIYSNFGELTPSAPDDSPGGSYDKASVIMTDGENYIPTVLYNSGTIPDFDVSNHVVFTGGFPFGYGDSWNTVSDKVYGNFDVSSDHNYTWSAKYRPGDEIFDLTLNECDIASYPDSDRGISTDCGLNLMLKGENSIGAEADPYDSGIYCANGMTVSAENGGSLDIFTDDAGIDAEDVVSFESGDISIIADDTGIQIYGDLTISDGNVTITAGGVGIDIEGTCEVIVSGDETVLNITAGTDDVSDEFYGINCYGMVMIDDATVSIEKLGEYGDGVWARSDIRISGDAQVKIVDWSLSDNAKCGIHSQNGDISIGGGSYVDIVSQSTGINAKCEGGVYIGYEWDGTNYTPSGSPTVRINNADSIAAVTPQINGNFIAGPYGICSSESDVRIAGGNLEVYTNDEDSYGIYANNMLEITGGSVTAFGTEQALYAGGEGEPITVDIPAYKHRTNTVAAVPTTPFSYYPDTAFDVSGAGDYKYVNIASTYAITKAESQNGSFTVMADGVPVSAAAHGDAVTLTAEPDENYSFVSWNVYKTDEESVTCTVENNVFTMPDYPVTIATTFAPIPIATVTFYSNVAVYDTKTVNIGESIGSAAWPANPTRSSYTFGGWFTGENGTGTEFTSATQVDSTITVYAKWTYSGGGGNGSGNTPPPPQRTITVTETSSELFIDTAGMITAEANMDSAFSNSVEVRVTDIAEDSARFNLSAGDEVYLFDISLYIKGTNEKTKPADGYAVTISLPIPENLVDKRTSLSVLHKSDNRTVTSLDSRLVQEDGVWYLVFDATEFSPYALVVRNSGSYDESAGVPYYINGNKNKVFIGFAANGKYIAPEGAIVSAMQNDKDFTDLVGHWAASDICFITERELFLGTGSNKFSPDTGMTRAMFATVIGRLYERSFGEIKSSDIHAFIDCDYGVYYGKYVDWAADNGIISGVGNSKFAPDILVTREQMAAILYRFADFLKVLPNELDTSLEYPDKASISSYAKNAALYCQTTDIITGRSGGVFAPQETATRAEVSIIIKRFIETVMK